MEQVFWVSRIGPYKSNTNRIYLHCGAALVEVPHTYGGHAYLDTTYELGGNRIFRDIVGSHWVWRELRNTWNELSRLQPV